jgi:hypothetical protein
VATSSLAYSRAWHGVAWPPIRLRVPRRLARHPLHALPLPRTPRLVLEGARRAGVTSSRPPTSPRPPGSCFPAQHGVVDVFQHIPRRAVFDARSSGRRSRCSAAADRPRPITEALGDHRSRTPGTAHPSPASCIAGNTAMPGSADEPQTCRPPGRRHGIGRRPCRSPDPAANTGGRGERRHAREEKLPVRGMWWRRFSPPVDGDRFGVGPPSSSSGRWASRLAR